MIAEFALTPSIFDESTHTDAETWRDQLRELGRSMFPRTASWPVMVSNLYAGSWHHVALTAVRAIKDRKARELCEDLLKNAEQTLVYRPVCHNDWPGEDAVAWGREAISSYGGEPIDRIVACKPAVEILCQECRFIRSIDEVEDAGFWSGIGSPWSQAMNIASQVAALRKLCVHSEWLCLVTPHIYGGGDDETDFALSLIQSAFHRPADYLRPEIEIHTEAPDDPVSADYANRLQHAAANIAGSIRRALLPGQKVRLILWPKLLDRYVLAGVYTEMADRTKTRRPRWGVAMQHIARKVDERDRKPATHWSLLPRKELGDQFARYCEDGVTGFVHREDVVP